MIDLFSNLLLRASDVTGNFLQAQVQIHSKELFTGFFFVSGSGQQVALLFSQGNLIAVYHFSGGRWVGLPKPEWNDLIASSAGDLRVVGTPVEGLRLLRLLFESDFSENRTVPSMQAGELSSYVSRWQRTDKAGLALISYEKMSVILLYPPREAAASDGILLSESQVETGSLLANRVKAWGERSCRVALCTYDGNSEAWKEYDLRVSFGKFMKGILKRYEEIAGHFLAADLDEQVNEETRNRGLAISLFGDTLSNRQFFENLKGAEHTYLSLFAMMEHQMEMVIGNKVMQTIHNDAILQLDLNARALIQNHILSNLGQVEAAV